MYKNAYMRSFHYNFFSLVNLSLSSQYHKNTRKAVPSVNSIGIYKCKAERKININRYLPFDCLVIFVSPNMTVPFYFFYSTIPVSPKFPLIYYSFQILPVLVASSMATLTLSFLLRSFSILSS